MIAVAYDQKERTVPTSRNNQSLEIVIWMYDNHRDGVIALRRWRADQTLKTNGVTRAAFAAARAHFGENQLLDLAGTRPEVCGFYERAWLRVWKHGCHSNGCCSET